MSSRSFSRENSAESQEVEHALLLRVNLGGDRGQVGGHVGGDAQETVAVAMNDLARRDMQAGDDDGAANFDYVDVAVGGRDDSGEDLEPASLDGRADRAPRRSSQCRRNPSPEKWRRASRR